MVPVSLLIELATAHPAPVVHAPMARHVIAATVLLCDCFAVGTLRDERVC
jgi:hypothetical protein